jgi:hypothetical protein
MTKATIAARLEPKRRRQALIPGDERSLSAILNFLDAQLFLPLEKSDQRSSYQRHAAVISIGSHPVRFK